MSQPAIKSRPAFRNGNHAGASAPVARRARRALARSQGAGEVQSLAARLQKGIAVVRTRAKRIAKAVGEQAARADKTVRAKPYHAAGIAAGAGLVAGYLISRRRPAAPVELK